MTTKAFKKVNNWHLSPHKNFALPICYTYAQCGKMKNLHTITEKIFRQINYLVISLEKTLLSRNFCQKSARVHKFLRFPHCMSESRVSNFRP